MQGYVVRKQCDIFWKNGGKVYRIASVFHGGTVNKQPREVAAVAVGIVDGWGCSSGPMQKQLGAKRVV